MLVAFDIGGTFTDVIVSYGDGRVSTAKVLSLLSEVGGDIAQFVRDHGVDESAVRGFIHGTTICSNALIEKTTPPVAFVTTGGFGSLLQMQSQRGPLVMRLDWENLPPLVPQHLVFELDERILADRSVARPLDPAEVEDVATKIRALGVTAIAVTLVNGYLNSSHEAAVRDILERALPEIPTCVSSDVDPEIKEYERASTTILNAALIPVVGHYLDELERHLDPLSPSLSIMQSNGGTMSSVVARQRPITMVESGPAAGVLAVAEMAKLLDLDQLVSFDMGGTTAKACLVENGEPLEKSEMEISTSTGSARTGERGYPLRAPSLDIVEVGAGGGSIAWIDRAGALHVGPASAGADPGPVCYGKGGTQPTVTDANIVLGYLSPTSIAGKTRIPVDRDAALRVINEVIAEPLGLDVLDAAKGIVDVANATMTRALRAVSTERGRDLRGLTLMAYGGGGPLHAVSLCEHAGVQRIVVPPFPGVFSAVGLLVAGDRLDYAHSIERDLIDVKPEDVGEAFETMRSAAARDLAAAGRDIDVSTIQLTLDVRYSHQPQEVSLPLESLDAYDAGAVTDAFKRAHELEFGFAGDGTLRLSRMRARVTSPNDRVSMAELVEAQEVDATEDTGIERDAYFGKALGSMPTPVVTSRLGLDRDGPLIIEEETTTIVVPPGWRARTDRFANVWLERH
jgi:N-methylhydantoinase A